MYSRSSLLYFNIKIHEIFHIRATQNQFFFKLEQPMANGVKLDAAKQIIIDETQPVLGQKETYNIGPPCAISTRVTDTEHTKYKNP